MTHALTSDLGLSYFNSAAVADDAFMLHPFIFTAVTFPVSGRTEDPFTEEAAFFRLETAIVNGFWILDFTETPGTDDFGRSHIDGYSSKSRIGGLSQQLSVCVCIIYQGSILQFIACPQQVS
jgi:hypothetical protein